MFFFPGQPLPSKQFLEKFGSVGLSQEPSSEGNTHRSKPPAVGWKADERAVLTLPGPQQVCAVGEYYGRLSCLLEFLLNFYFAFASVIELF